MSKVISGLWVTFNNLNTLYKGKLSWVGPRPEREIFYNEFETYVHGFHERLKVKPGLTGLAQVNGGYDLKPEEGCGIYKASWAVAGCEDIV